MKFQFKFVSFILVILLGLILCSTAVQIYVPLLTEINEVKISPKQITYSTLEPITISWTYKTIQPPAKLQLTPTHNDTIIIAFELLIEGDESNIILLGSQSIPKLSKTVTIPTTVPAGKHTLRLISVHDYTISTTTELTIALKCNNVTCQANQQCNPLNGQCECDKNAGYVTNPASPSLPCVPRCQTLTCLNNSTCDPNIDPKVCTCSKTLTNANGAALTFVGETCNAITTRFTGCNKNCATGGYQIYDSTTKTCNGQCECTLDNWTKHPLLGVCSVCWLQSQSFCHPTNTDLEQSYLSSGSCDKCFCLDGYTGSDCSYRKLYFSIYIGTFAFNGLNPSTRPTTNDTSLLSKEERKARLYIDTINEIDVSTVMKQQQQEGSTTTPLLSESEIKTFIDIISTALNQARGLISIENNIAGSSRFIFSIGFKAPTAATNIIQQITQFSTLATLPNNNYQNNIQSIDELNLLWLQFRKQLALSFVRNAAIWNKFGNFIPDVMYDSSCPSLDQIRTQINSTFVTPLPKSTPTQEDESPTTETDETTPTTTDPVSMQLQSTSVFNLESYLHELQSNAYHQSIKIEFDPMKLLANNIKQFDDFELLATDAANKFEPISYATNIKYSNPLVNPFTYRCVFNNDPFRYASVDSSLPSSTTTETSTSSVQNPSTPLSDDYYLYLDLSLPIYNPTQPESTFVKFQGPWIDNHKTELIVSIFLGAVFTFVVFIVAMKEIPLLLDPSSDVAKHTELD